LGPLVTKIHDREAADIEKKKILTSVQGCPGNIRNLMGRGTVDQNENESNEETMHRRVKDTQRLKAIVANREERERKKETLSNLVAASAAALAMATNSNGPGMNEKVAQLTIDQKHLKRKVDQIENKVVDLNSNVQDMKREFGEGLTRIEELINKRIHQN
jgi:outer membrane murein-binding lipoprotein Lpp